MAVNGDLFQTYKKLIQLRNQHSALSLGDFQTLLTDDEREIYVYRRSYAGQTLIVALNNKRHSQQLTLELPPGSSPVDLLNGESYSAHAGKATIELRPLWGVVLKT